MEKIRVFTAFSGYDSQCLSLDRLKKKYPEFDYELVGWSEIDKYAIQAHNAIYPQWADRNYGDISKINWDEVPDFDLFTYSSPCQDFSNAGLQRGGEEGSGTRSSLLWECRRAIVAKRPKFLLMENVAALVSQKFIKTFNKWQEELARYGYTNFAQVLNAKHYGVPQNRERIFLVSIHGDAWYNFPQPVKLTKRLKDVLEPVVDEKYYLSEKILKGFERTSADKSHGHKMTELVPRTDGVSNTLTSVQKDNLVVEPQIINPLKDQTEYGWHFEQAVYDADGITRAVKAGEGSGNIPKVVEPQIIQAGYVNEGRHQQDYIQHEDGISRAICCGTHGSGPHLTKTLVSEATEDSATTICLNSKVDGKQPSLEHRIYDSRGISTAVTTGFHPSVALHIPEATAKGYAEAYEGDSVNLEQPNSKTRRRRVGKQMANTLTTSNAQGVVTPNYRIRKLTPRECFRLMDVDENVIDIIQAAGISNSQQYKLAGNSIVVACLEKIFEQMFFPQYTNSRTLF